MNALVKSQKKPPAGLAAAQVAGQEKQYLTFMLGGEMFSISILSIKEIIWYTEPTPVPMMPSCIRGVINLRGSVMPVMDLSQRFGKASTSVVKSTCIVIIEVNSNAAGEHQAMGVVVDSVQAVLEIPASEIEPSPSFGAKIRPDFIEGIAKVSGKFVILLDANRVLSPEEIGQMGQVAALAPD
jgi:purine-binding chemotaxis protein CheW